MQSSVEKFLAMKDEAFAAEAKAKYEEEKRNKRLDEIVSEICRDFDRIVAGPTYFGEPVFVSISKHEVVIDDYVKDRTEIIRMLKVLFGDSIKIEFKENDYTCSFMFS